MALSLSLVFAVVGAAGAAAPFDCSFASSYPRQYVAYKAVVPPAIDGVVIGDPVWDAVPWTERFVDIATTISPHFATRAKIRYDSTFLYVAATLDEPQAWANISSTCHCIDPSEDQVIFHDNDFEVFVDAPGTTHNYKEFEINVVNATWDLQLNRTYDDGGSENSSRVFGPQGWDYALPVGRPSTLHSAVHVTGGRANDPATGTQSWSVEVAMPLAKLVENTPATAPPTPGQFWRINFSRVEWAVRVVNGAYQKYPSCQSCLPVGSPSEDNWVWSPMGAVAMHAPERWGILQFSDSAVNATPAARYTEWPVRAAAAAVYNAQVSYASAHGGAYSASTAALLPYLASPDIVSGACSAGVPVFIALSPGGGYVATVPPYIAGDNAASATIDQQRLLLVTR